MKTFSTKQVSEEYFIRFGFAEKLGTGNDIVSVNSIAAADLSDDSDATATLIDDAASYASGQDVYVFVQAGTSGRQYKITVKITGPNSEIYELEGILPVRDI